MKDLRIAHVSDTHLGYRAAAVPGRDEDFARSWIFACQAIVESKPDIIIHAGDLFHHPHPSWGAVARFFEGAYILRQANVPILMISGNHDSSRIYMKHTVFSILKEMLPDITIANDDNPLRVSVDNLETDVVLLPHRALLNPLLSERLEEITSSLDPLRYAILIAHGDVGKNTKGENNELGSIAIPELVFSHPWSYIALGHLHMAQPFTQTGWYSGSIERCGWSDYPADPAWTTAYISKTKPIRHHQNSLPHRRFVQPNTFSCGDVSDFELHDEIMRSLLSLKLKDDPTIVRLVFDDVTNSRIRFLEKTIKDNVRRVYPNVAVQVAIKKTIQARETHVRETRAEKLGTLTELFKEFVAGRTYTDPSLKDVVLEGGLAAIRKVQESDADNDTGDERTVAVA